MSLIIATGSNQGNRLINLEKAKTIISKKFDFLNESRVYHSKAVDYSDQPDFYNQVLEYKLPKNSSPDDTMDTLLLIELELGRIRDANSKIKGPRAIDIDILFFGLSIYPGPKAIIPHPRLFERSFVVLPLSELPYFQELKKSFDFPNTFTNQAFPINI